MLSFIYPWGSLLVFVSSRWDVVLNPTIMQKVIAQGLPSHKLTVTVMGQRILQSNTATITWDTYLQYFYYDKGFLEEEVLIDAEGNVIRRAIYHYDDSCFKSDLDRVIGDSYGTESVTVYCDDNGNIRLRQFDYDEDPLIDEEVEYSVDEFGYITSETHYDENGDELDASYRSYHTGYDDDGNLLSRTGYSFNDIIFFKSTYTYLDGKIRSWEFARFTGGEYNSTSIVHYIYE